MHERRGSGPERSLGGGTARETGGGGDHCPAFMVMTGWFCPFTSIRSAGPDLQPTVQDIQFMGGSPNEFRTPTQARRNNRRDSVQLLPHEVMTAPPAVASIASSAVAPVCATACTTSWTCGSPSSQDGSPSDSWRRARHPQSHRSLTSRGHSIVFWRRAGAVPCAVWGASSQWAGSQRMGDSDSERAADGWRICSGVGH